jgi:hypothetical protein
MSRFNIFRNPYTDAQLGYLLDTMVDSRRRETESYWRTVIAEEVKNSCSYFRNDGIACIDCLDTIDIIYKDKS